MWSGMKKSVLFAGVFLGLASGTARASSLGVLEVKVPFPFVVNGQTLPAGQYMVRRDDIDSSVLLIRGENGNPAVAFVTTMTAAGRDPLKTPALSFTVHDKQYWLSNIWESRRDGQSVVGRS